MININPGIKLGTKQPFTITIGQQLSFVVYDELYDTVSFNCFVEEDRKPEIEEILRNYLTNR